MAKFCRFCGSPINEGVRFCPECGKKLAEDLPPQPKNQPVTPAPQRPFYQTPQQQTPAQPPKTLQTAYAVNTPPVRTAPSQAPQTTVAPNQTNSPAPGRVFCPKCGSVVDAGVRFCSKCGAQIPQTTSQTSPQASVRQSQNQPYQPQAPVRQTVQSTVGQAANGFGVLSGVNALPAAGEFPLDLPGFSAPSAQSGGVPGILKFLISIAAGGISIPVLNQLGSPWSFLIGAAVFVLLIVISSKIKKSKGDTR